ncbi:Voltage-dependent T-type calcium channel subunit alpha [Caenorhabditis elegans]|uniref:Voltage-dependent T-type calcium channel subunit alpha n=1 Tax=Caenorhabditis elegans TaxID=6239 RepID=A0A0K3ASP4_CAEEL|nr:Voltage-dependent T-type calcium channel subunit alpha [Caenorhabditis elegans]CTQ87048.1 Voltage-dependent T-type calcium channel subunit alpha [Caenorhabditis elegans]|eukprot:NP_001300337.1 Voltage-dependent T-type calcium channel subunit alpha [Caenorhabditis elegans]
MLRQPVPELRSFQSLSKYAGGPRSVLGRRTSAITVNRRQSQSTRRHEDVEALGSIEGSKETLQLSEHGRLASSSEASPSRWEGRQIEWGNEEQIEEESELPYPGFAEPALRCFYQARPPRKWALQMVMSPWFDRITMAVIMINCVTLGMYRPCEDGPDCDTYRCQILDIIDNCIFVYFAFEMVIKIMALGFYGPAAYMSDTWNRLDFFIVMAGIAEFVLHEYLGGNINLTAIRTVRVLRPLRAVNRIPSMRILVNLLLDTLPMLGNVLLLCFFVFFIFGIVGVQLWAGLLRNRCVINLPKTISENQSALFNNVKLTRFYIPEDTSLEYICSQPDANGLHTCSNLPPYTVDGVKCNLTLDEYDKVTNDSCINWNIYYNECQVMQRNPFQGSVSFDNIGFAWVAIFLVISLEGWTDIMYYVQDAHSFWNWIYFVLLIVIGAFFMINLCLVVIATQFAETKRRETERMLQERKMLLNRDSISCTGSEIGGASSKEEGDTVYAAFVRFIGHTFRRTKRAAKKKYTAYMEERAERKSSERQQRRKSKLDDMATLSRIEEKAEDEEDETTITRENGDDQIEQNGDGVRIKRVKIEEEPKIKIGNGNSNGPHYKHSSSDEESDEDGEEDQVYDGEEAKKKSTPSKLWWFREKIQKFVICDHFTRGILVAILVNTLSMGVEYHQQPEILTVILEYSNLFFTALFALEMLLKIIASGLFGYLADGFNLFDGGIVALSVLELFQEGKGGLSVLRTFRLLRILKLVRFMPALRYQLVVMLRTMDNVTVFFGLLVLFIFIFSTLGMVLFGCKFCNHPDTGLQCTSAQVISSICECDRMNFDNFLFATVTVFQILTQEDWNMVLFNGMAQTNPWAALYFVALMTFGNYVLFNLLVAILVEGFQESKEEEKRQLEEDARKQAVEEEDERKRELELIIAKTTSPAFNNGVAPAECTCQRPSSPEESPSPRLLSANYHPSPERKHSANLDAIIDKRLVLRNSAPFDRSPVSEGRDDSRLNRHASLVLPVANGVPYRRQRVHSWSGLCHHFNPNCPVHGRRALIETYAREKFLEASQELKQALAEEEKRNEAKQNTFVRKLLKKTCLHNRTEFSLFLMGPKNPLRIKCLQTTQKKWFDYTVLFFIGINCITLAMERPSIPPDSFERQFLHISGYIFTVIFTGEMMMKVIANGCFIGQAAYFKDGWNILDGILVVISLINIAFELLATGDSPKIFGVIRVLRLLRALRPLRVINRAPGVKLVVMTLISSLKPIGNIVLICCTFFIIFGILGVQLFKGMMYHCIGPEVGNVTTKADCIEDYRNKWVNHRYNFDNLGQALMSLFVLSSKDGWVSIMYQGIDAVGVDVQPIENYNEWRMIYFISFLLLVGFFVLNMFVGVVVENFHKCKEALEKEMREKEKEKRLKRKLKRQKFEESMAGKRKKNRIVWAGSAIKSIFSVERNYPYYHDYGHTRLFLHGIVTSKYFDLAIAAVIGINVISMAMEFYMMPMGLKYVLKALNYFFTAVFTLEAAMKLIALGFKRFFIEKWNRLDMFIVILSIAGIIFEEFEALELPINPTIIRVMRVLRIARVLKLLKMAKGIRSLLDTVGEALPQVGNLGSLFFLLFFIFAALGVELFGKLECSEDHPCDGLGEHAHFKNFGMAFLTLFRIATGDNWNGIMKDALRDDCDSSDHCETNCCVDPILAPCFFVIFVLISQFVLVNVVVAVLMKHLEESNKRDAEGPAEPTGENIENEITKSDDDEIVEEHEPLAIEHVKEGELDEEEETEEGPTTQIPDGHGGIKRLSMQVLEQELIEVERHLEERYRRASECLGGELQPLNPGEIEDLDDPEFRPRSRSHRPRARTNSALSNKSRGSHKSAL